MVGTPTQGVEPGVRSNCSSTCNSHLQDRSAVVVTLRIVLMVALKAPGCQFSSSQHSQFTRFAFAGFLGAKNEGDVWLVSLAHSIDLPSESTTR